jgi:hypothetical protein
MPFRRNDIPAGPGGNNFSFAWLNSAGPATEGIGSDPGLVTLAEYNDPATSPGRLDLARGTGNNQQRDIIKVIQRLKPKIYYPGHLTAVAQPGSAHYHKINWQETALNMGFPQSEWPEFRLQIDPNDFLMPQVFTPSDERWAERGRSARVPDMCR